MKIEILSLFLLSPSSRRAWIEISVACSEARRSAVALLAEGVDRNKKGTTKTKLDETSPSSRRAWIEISEPRRLWRFH